MGFWIKRGAVALAILVAVSQFVRPAMTNPPIEPSHTIQASLPQASEMLRVIDRSCGDCHSNRTVWPWYTNVAPVSWLIAHDVTEGRQAVNFSEWAAYDASRKAKLLKDACDEAKEGEMPPLQYSLMHPDAKLTTRDVDAVCGAASQRDKP